MMRAEGFGLVQLVLAVFLAAILGIAFYRYIASATKTTGVLREQRPLAAARLAADHATLAAIRAALEVHHAERGRWPADKDAAIGLLPSRPVFRCAGNDFDYDPADGQVQLLIDDPARC